MLIKTGYPNILNSCDFLCFNLMNYYVNLWQEVITQLYDDLLITKDTDCPVRQTNQNSNQIHIADKKPGIKLVSQLSFDLVLFLTEWI